MGRSLYTGLNTHTHDSSYRRTRCYLAIMAVRRVTGGRAMALRSGLALAALASCGGSGDVDDQHVEEVEEQEEVEAKDEADAVEEEEAVEPMEWGRSSSRCRCRRRSRPVPHVQVGCRSCRRGSWRGSCCWRPRCSPGRSSNRPS